MTAATLDDAQCITTVEHLRRRIEEYHESEGIHSSLRAVAVEVALHNRVRYPWPELKPLYHILINECLNQYQPEVITEEEEEETATLVGKNSGDAGDYELKADLSSLREDSEIFIQSQARAARDLDRQEIHCLLDTFDSEPPFTIQRLSEILLEPKKQYRKMDKVLHSLRIALMVTTTHSGECVPISADDSYRVSVSDFSKVNENPPSWYTETSNTETTNE